MSAVATDAGCTLEHPLGLHPTPLYLKWGGTNMAPVDLLRAAIGIQDGLDEPDIQQDVDVAREVLRKAFSIGDGRGGHYTMLTTEQLAACRRLLDEAAEYAATCDYDEDESSTPAERWLASDAANSGVWLFCWPELAR